MKINPKVTGALAWTGLVLVLAVPAADMLGGKSDARANLTSDMDQVKTASVKPVAKPAVKTTVPAIESATAGADPVTDFVKGGKKLPSYISSNDSPVVETATVPVAPVKKPGTITINPDGTIARPAAAPLVVQEPGVASVKPQLVAPVPLPASARPKPQTATALPQTVTTLPAPTEAPLIIDESQVASTGPLPPQDIVPADDFISDEELEEWDSGSLADYLARRGLMSDASQAQPATEYDADGFFLDEGPNNRRRSRVIVLNNDRTF